MLLMVMGSFPTPTARLRKRFLENFQVRAEEWLVAGGRALECAFLLYEYQMKQFFLTVELTIMFWSGFLLSTNSIFQIVRISHLQSSSLRFFRICRLGHIG